MGKWVRQAQNAPGGGKMGAYGAFAEVYDLLMDDFDYPAWAQYYLKLLETAGVQPKTMAECACGTGSMTIPFAEAGIRVTGVDLSGEMLEIAAGKGAAGGRSAHVRLSGHGEADASAPGGRAGLRLRRRELSALGQAGGRRFSARRIGRFAPAARWHSTSLPNTSWKRCWATVFSARSATRWPISGPMPTIRRRESCRWI